MDIDEFSKLIYDYTSGYLYLVSRICQTADEKLADFLKVKQMLLGAAKNHGG